MYDDLDIELSRRFGRPDPEGNAARARSIFALIQEERFEEARSRIDEVTDSWVRDDLKRLIEFNSTCRCIHG